MLTHTLKVFSVVNMTKVIRLGMIAEAKGRNSDMYFSFYETKRVKCFSVWQALADFSKNNIQYIMLAFILYLNVVFSLFQINSFLCNVWFSTCPFLMVSEFAN